MDNLEVLNLYSGPPRRPGAILISLLGIFFLVSTGLRLHRAQTLFDHFGGMLVGALMIVAFIAVLARNFAFSESLDIVRAVDRELAAQKTTIFCDDIVEVAQADSPAYGTPAWSLYLLGFSPGAVLIRTKRNGTLSFGSGIDPNHAEQLVARVRNFCGME